MLSRGTVRWQKRCIRQQMFEMLRRRGIKMVYCSVPRLDAKLTQVPARAGENDL